MKGKITGAFSLEFTSQHYFLECLEDFKICQIFSEFFLGFVLIVNERQFATIEIVISRNLSINFLLTGAKILLVKKGAFLFLKHEFTIHNLKV